MRVVALLGLSTVGALLASVSIARVVHRLHPAARGPISCAGRAGAPAGCSIPAHRTGAKAQPLPAGDPPAFLFASVQPIKAPESWRRIYHEVEQCAGKKGDYDAIRWAVMEAPLHGPKGPTYAFTVGSRVVLVRDDTTFFATKCSITSWRFPAGIRVRSSRASTTPSPTCTRCRSSACAPVVDDGRHRLGPAGSAVTPSFPRPRKHPVPRSGEHRSPSVAIANPATWRRQLGPLLYKEGPMGTYHVPQVEKPSPVQLAIKEWQRQLIEKQK